MSKECMSRGVPMNESLINSEKSSNEEKLVHRKTYVKKSLKGMTLVEVIVVLAIIGILAAVLVVNGLRWLRETKIDDANANAKMLFDSVQTVVQDYNSKNWDKIYKGTYNGKTYDFTVTPVLDEFLAYYNGTNLTITHFKFDSGAAIPQLVISTVGTTFQDRFLMDIQRYYSDARKNAWLVYVKDYLVQEVMIADNRDSDLFGAYPRLSDLDTVSSYTTISDLADDTGAGHPINVLAKLHAEYVHDEDFQPVEDIQAAPELTLEVKLASPSP